MSIKDLFVNADLSRAVTALERIAETLELMLKSELAQQGIDLADLKEASWDRPEAVEAASLPERMRELLGIKLKPKDEVPPPERLVFSQQDTLQDLRDLAPGSPEWHEELRAQLAKARQGRGVETDLSEQTLSDLGIQEPIRPPFATSPSPGPPDVEREE